ncbi:MAG: class I SAM-dependent methyltransferase, partial [Candidatus Eremiobacteraeota bacterium]|nr:class I SAM-dependent methyltransferase [Candidatus Eremiobacteraeota bacterium]
MSERGPAPDHFTAVVRDWSQLGPPLRPSPEDSAIVRRVAAELKPGARVAVLGLTPEILACSWPAETKLIAIDHSVRMIAALWKPEQITAEARIAVADWRAVPLESASIDFTAGDGCFTMFPYPDEMGLFAREVARIVRPRGRFVTRQFLRPAHAESIETIAQQLSAGAIGSVHALKLRILAALHAKNGEGTLLAGVYPVWKAMPPIPASLRGRPGWTEPEIASIESYRDRPGRFHLPTLEELRT